MASLKQSVKQWLGLTPRKEDQIAAALYTQAVTQARLPAWYLQGGVPDTLDGRFEMILLHVFALQERLMQLQDKNQSNAIQRALSESFFRDMDRSLRELGVADTGVRRRIKNMAEAYFGRLAAYQKAREDGADAWLTALSRNLYGSHPVGDVQWVAAQIVGWMMMHQQQDDTHFLQSAEHAAQAAS